MLKEDLYIVLHPKTVHEDGSLSCYVVPDAFEEDEGAQMSDEDGVEFQAFRKRYQQFHTALFAIFARDQQA